MFDRRFADRVVVVTGAAQGIGAAVARRAALEGACVVLGDRSPWAKQVADEIEEARGRALAHECDLESFTGAESLVETVVREHGRIDVWINNVGGTIWTRPFEHYDVGGDRAGDQPVPYAAAKGGVNALTASLAFEAASKGVRVVATAPGGTETHLSRYATLDEQVAPILFLASDEASYITGSVLPVGGGDHG